MANYYWDGSTDTSFATAGNWTPSGPPGDGDALWFKDNTPNACTTNMDRAGVNFTKVIVGRNYPHNVGSSTDELRAGMDQFDMEGPGIAWIEGDDAAGQMIDVVNVYNGRVYINNVVAYADTATVRLFKGVLVLEDGGFTTVDVLAKNAGDATLIVNSPVDTLTTLRINNGRVESSCTVHASVTLNRGVLVLRDAAAVTTGAAKIITYSGTVRHNSSGAITTYEQHPGGTYTSIDNQNVGTTTITTADLYGGTFDLRSAGGGVTATTINIRDRNVSLLFSPGKTLTIGDI